MEKPSSAEQARERAEQSVRGQIERIVKMAKSMRMDPDLTPVWDGDEFRALPADVQTSVREWAASKGYPVESAEAEAEAQAASEVDEEPSSEPAPQEPAPERKEKRESAEPKRRQFVRYRVERRDDGSFALREDYQEWDRRAEEYRDKSVETSIAFTGALAAKMEADPDVMATVAGFSAQVREELDRSTVKMYFDRPKGDPEKVFPKWKYALEGKTVEEPIKPADIPADIMALVKTDKQYFKTDAWKKWFGRQMQKKREDVIAAELAKLFPDAAPAPETVKPEPEPAPEAKAAEQEAPEVAVVTPELAAGIGMLVDKFSPLFELPRQSAELIDYVTTFSKGIFEYQLMQKGKAAKKPALPPEALKAAVREALLAKFADEPKTAAEIRRLTDVAPPATARETEKFSGPPAPPKEDDEDVIEVQDEWIEQSLDAERREDPVDSTYLALREDLDKQLPLGGIDAYVAKLKEIKKAGLDTVSAAADRLLNDIDFGKAGEASEDRTSDASRSEDEERFFAEHPLLDKRNVQRLPDGRVIVHVDRLHPEDSLRRAFGRAVQDAMDRRDIDGGPHMVAKIAEYLLRIVTGKNENKALLERFTKDLAAYDARAEEMTIKNVDKLGGVIANLIREIESKMR